MNLSDKRCVACEGGVPPLWRKEIEAYLPAVPGWTALGDKKIAREFAFRDFREAMRFVNDVAGVAESEGHHPDIHIAWNKVRLELSTHEIGGLSENDFILAAKINSLRQPNPA